MKCPFQIGDHVRPIPLWRDSPNLIPSGRVRAIANFGEDGALYVGNDHRAFGAYVFEKMEPAE